MMNMNMNEEKRIDRAMNQGRAIADVVGDPFGTAEEYRAMDHDRGEVLAEQLSFDDLPPTEAEWLESLTIDALVTTHGMELERRFGYTIQHPGILHDGHSLRFMTARDRKLWVRRALPQDWVVIVPPSETGVTMAPEEVPYDNPTPGATTGNPGTA